MSYEERTSKLVGTGKTNTIMHTIEW